MPNSETDMAIVAFGAHPDDIEFACGAIIAKATQAGQKAHFVVCSRGESATRGTAEQRVEEARRAAEILGASIEFIELDGDAHLEIRTAHTIKLAAMLRSVRPQIVLAPSLVENQHPDHARLGKLVRDATRLARYGGLEELRHLPAHAIGQLFYYAVSVDAEPREITPVFFDVSAPEIISVWTLAMSAHQTQMKTRNYVEFQLSRARTNGLRAGVGYTIALYPNSPLLFDSLASLSRSSNYF